MRVSHGLTALEPGDSGYQFGVTCRVCGGDVDHLTNGLVADESSKRPESYWIKVSQAVVHCAACCTDYVLRLVMEPGPAATVNERQQNYQARKRANA